MNQPERDSWVFEYLLPILCVGIILYAVLHFLSRYANLFGSFH